MALRVINRDGSSPLVNLTMAEAVEALMKECMAANPVTVFLAYETTEKTGDGTAVSLVIKSIPESLILREGYAGKIFDTVCPPRSPEN